MMPFGSKFNVGPANSDVLAVCCRPSTNSDFLAVCLWSGVGGLPLTSAGIAKGNPYFRATCRHFGSLWDHFVVTLESLCLSHHPFNYVFFDCFFKFARWSLDP